MKFSRSMTFVCALIFAISSAQAYAPTAGFIFNLVANKRQKHKVDALRVVVKRTDYVNGQAAEPYEVTITFRSSGRMRTEWTDKDGKHARVTDGNKGLKVDADKRTPGKLDPSVMAALWTVGTDDGEKTAVQERAGNLLAAANVMDSPVSYSRTDGRIAWVVGAQPRDLNVPQLWIDKDEFVPLRFIHPEPGVQVGPLIDERMRGWGSAAGGDFYPGRTEVYRDNVLIRLDELARVDVTPKIDEREFKLE